MSEKKYLSDSKLSLYDSKLKAKMASDDASTLGSAKSYTDSELEGFASEMDEALDALTSAVNGKAPSVHGHAISDVTGLQSELNSKATKDIAGRYGGLENLGEQLMNSENFEMALSEIIWLITVLANQSIMIHNIKNRENPKPLLTEEEVELLTAPYELAEYKTAITEALYKGTKRNIVSEVDSKNEAVE